MEAQKDSIYQFRFKCYQRNFASTQADAGSSPLDTIVYLMQTRILHFQGILFDSTCFKCIKTAKLTMLIISALKLGGHTNHKVQNWIPLLHFLLVKTSPKGIKCLMLFRKNAQQSIFTKTYEVLQQGFTGIYGQNVFSVQIFSPCTLAISECLFV